VGGPYTSLGGFQGGCTFPNRCAFGRRGGSVDGLGIWTGAIKSLSLFCVISFGGGGRGGQEEVVSTFWRLPGSLS